MTIGRDPASRPDVTRVTTPSMTDGGHHRDFFDRGWSGDSRARLLVLWHIQKQFNTIARNPTRDDRI